MFKIDKYKDSNRMVAPVLLTLSGFLSRPHSSIATEMSYGFFSWEKTKSPYQEECERLHEKRARREANGLTEMDMDEADRYRRFTGDLAIWIRYKPTNVCPSCGSFHPVHPNENMCRFGYHTCDEEDKKIKEYAEYVRGFMPVSRMIRDNRIDLVEKAIKEGKVKYWSYKDRNDDFSLMIKLGRVEMVEMVLKSGQVHSGTNQHAIDEYRTIYLCQLQHLDYEYNQNKSLLKVSGNEHYARKAAEIKEQMKAPKAIEALFDKYGIIYHEVPYNPASFDHIEQGAHA